MADQPNTKEKRGCGDKGERSPRLGFPTEFAAQVSALQSGGGVVQQNPANSPLRLTNIYGLCVGGADTRK